MKSFISNIFHNFRESVATPLLPRTTTAVCVNPNDKLMFASDELAEHAREIEILRNSIYRRTDIELTAEAGVDISEFGCYVKNNQLHFIGIIYVTADKARGDLLLSTKNLLHSMPSNIGDVAFFPVAHTGYNYKSNEAIALRKDGFYAGTAIDYSGSGRAYSSVALTLPLFIPYGR